MFYWDDCLFDGRCHEQHRVTSRSKILLVGDVVSVDNSITDSNCLNAFRAKLVMRIWDNSYPLHECAPSQVMSFLSVRRLYGYSMISITRPMSEAYSRIVQNPASSAAYSSNVMACVVWINRLPKLYVDGDAQCLLLHHDIDKPHKLSTFFLLCFVNGCAKLLKVML